MKKKTYFYTGIALVLAFTGGGGIFAQDAADTADTAGKFIWGGEVRIGADINVDREGAVSTNGNHEYGLAKVNYQKGALNTELAGQGWFKSKSAKLTGLLEYGDGINGDTSNNFRCAIKLRILDSDGKGMTKSPPSYKLHETGTLVIDTTTTPSDGTYEGDITVTSTDSSIWTPDLLYCYWKFFNRQLLFDISYKGRDEAFWGVPEEVVVSTSYDNFDGKAGLGLLLKPTAIDGLSFGVKIPINVNFIGSDYNAYAYLRHTIAGFKYNKGKVTAAGAFQYNKDYGDSLRNDAEYTQRAYIGGKYKFNDNVYTGADAEFRNYYEFKNAAEKNDTSEAKRLSGGPHIQYSSGAFITGVHGEVYVYLDDKYKDTASDSEYHVQPYVRYAIIKDTLQARLRVRYVGGLNDVDRQKSVWFRTGLYWNAKGDGVTDDMGRGCILEYDLRYDFDAKKILKHNIGAYFRWNF